MVKFQWCLSLTPFNPIFDCFKFLNHDKIFEKNFHSH
ncbi:MAG: hypothetical protein RLZZ155_341, partial [Bacteroidota bacterium]